MEWSVTTSEEDAKIRIQKTTNFQKTHDTYLVYKKENGEAIGLAFSLGFQLIGTEEKQDKRDNQIYILQKYSLKL